MKEADMREGFYPPDASPGKAALNTLDKKFCSESLRAMQEPSLWVLSEDPTAHAYRFLWLPTFDLPVAVRLTIDQNGAGQLATKITTRSGDEGMILVSDEVRTPRAKDLRMMLASLSALDFWGLPSYNDASGRDGADWILEGVQDGRYHLVYRWSPPKGAFKETALLLTRFAHVTGRSLS